MAALIGFHGGSELAAAHGETVESRPAPGAVLDRAPTEVELQMSAALGEGSSIQVLDADFRRIELGPTRIDEAAPDRMRVDLPPLDPGDYTVQWTAVDAGDGHRTHGSFGFSLRAARGAGPLGAMGLLLVLGLVIGWWIRGKHRADEGSSLDELEGGR